MIWLKNNLKILLTQSSSVMSLTMDIKVSKFYDMGETTELTDIKKGIFSPKDWEQVP